MLIRSQDKKHLINMESVISISVSVKSVCAYSNNKTVCLGDYEHEIVAIKVLDMIQNKYFEHMTVENNGAIVNVLERPKVFLMPQDSEV